jgi:hypothetical protein
MWLPVELLALKRIATTSDLKTFKVPQAELETHTENDTVLKPSLGMHDRDDSKDLN